MDYILTDSLVTPPDQQRFYTEKFVYLPDTFMATDDRQPISQQVYSRSDFGLPDDAFVFCSFNNAYKIDADRVRLLDAPPEAGPWQRPVALWKP